MGLTCRRSHCGTDWVEAVWMQRYRLHAHSTLRLEATGTQTYPLRKHLQTCCVWLTLASTLVDMSSRSVQNPTSFHSNTSYWALFSHSVPHLEQQSICITHGHLATSGLTRFGIINHLWNAQWKHLVKLLYKFWCVVWTATVNFTSRCSIHLQASEAIRNAGSVVLYSRERRQEEESIHVWYKNCLRWYNSKKPKNSKKKR